MTWASTPGVVGAQVFVISKKTLQSKEVMSVLGSSKSNSFLWLPSKYRVGIYKIIIGNVAQLATPASGGYVQVHFPVKANASSSPTINDLPNIRDVYPNGTKVPVGGVHDGTIHDNTDDSSFFGSTFGSAFDFLP